MFAETPANEAITFIFPVCIPVKYELATPELSVVRGFGEIFAVLFAVKFTVAPAIGYPSSFTVAINWSGMPTESV